MKKVLFLLIVTIFVITGCNKEELKIEEITNVPDKVQDAVNPNVRLQTVTFNEKGTYVVFHSSGEVKVNLESKGDMVIVNFNVLQEEEELKQFTYFLKFDSKYEVIDYRLNGESIPVDEAVIL